MSKNDKNQGLQPTDQDIVHDTEQDCNYEEQYYYEQERYAQEQSDIAWMIREGWTF